MWLCGGGGGSLLVADMDTDTGRREEIVVAIGPVIPRPQTLCKDHYQNTEKDTHGHFH